MTPKQRARRTDALMISHMSRRALCERIALLESFILQSHADIAPKLDEEEARAYASELKLLHLEVRNEQS